MQRFNTPLSHRQRGVHPEPSFDWQSPGLNYLNTYFTHTLPQQTERQNLKYSQTLPWAFMATRAWMALQMLVIIQWNAQTAWINMQIDACMHRCICRQERTHTHLHSRSETWFRLFLPQARLVKCAPVSVFNLCGLRDFKPWGKETLEHIKSVGMRGFMA